MQTITYNKKKGKNIAHTLSYCGRTKGDIRDINMVTPSEQKQDKSV